MCQWVDMGNPPDIWETSCGNFEFNDDSCFPPYKVCPYCGDTVQYQVIRYKEIDGGNENE